MGPGMGYDRCASASASVGRMRVPILRVRVRVPLNQHLANLSIAVHQHSFQDVVTCTLQVPTDICSSSEEWRHGGVGCRQAEAPHRSPIALIGAYQSGSKSRAPLCCKVVSQMCRALSQPAPAARARSLGALLTCLMRDSCTPALRPCDRAWEPGAATDLPCAGCVVAPVAWYLRSDLPGSPPINPSLMPSTHSPVLQRPSRLLRSFL